VPYQVAISINPIYAQWRLLTISESIIPVFIPFGLEAILDCLHFLLNLVAGGICCRRQLPHMIHRGTVGALEVVPLSHDHRGSLFLGAVIPDLTNVSPIKHCSFGQLKLHTRSTTWPASLLLKTVATSLTPLTASSTRCCPSGLKKEHRIPSFCSANFSFPCSGTSQGAHVRTTANHLEYRSALPCRHPFQPYDGMARYPDVNAVVSYLTKLPHGTPMSMSSE